MVHRQAKKRYDRNPELKRRQVKKYCATLKGRITKAAAGAKRRGVENGLRIEKDVVALKDVYRRAQSADCIRCYLCGKITLQGERHVDHVIPLSRGGAHVSSNLAIACAVCNESKNNRTPEEYRQYQLEAVTA